jgi:hypothetical protein
MCWRNVRIDADARRDRDAHPDGERRATRVVQRRPRRPRRARRMSDRLSFAGPPPSAPVRGLMKGTVVGGGMDWFIKTYGAAAAHEVIARAGPATRAFLTPNTPSLGLLGSRSYPYPVIGDLVRTMAAVAKVPEEDFARALTAAAVTTAMSTVNRVAVRYLVSVRELARRAPEMWDMFYDSGRLTVLACDDHEYLVQGADWPQHDDTVCRLGMEARRFLVEKTGERHVQLFRDKCVRFGHDVCVSRVRWQ